MILKRLEISGFKSFADKHALDFPYGISGIVGPNGSGKSNVADALRWVMGDQSMKSLRVHKGEDLIFSGVDKKKNTGRATVKIIFDNRSKRFPIDFEELIIERKIFHSGESSYFMNGSQVRLKDVAQMLAHARLGLSGYTIIGQGMGDSMVGASPKERLAMIEEALGLEPLQIKKEDAIRRLEETKTNLSQAQNLILELEPHLRFLRRQVEKLKKRDELQLALDQLRERYQKELAKIVHFKVAKAQVRLQEVERALHPEKETLERVVKELQTMKQQTVSGVEEDFSQEKEIAHQREAILLEIGQLEGRLHQAQQKTARPKEALVRWSKISRDIVEIKNILSHALTFSEIDAAQKEIRSVITRLEKMLAEEQGSSADFQESQIDISELNNRQKVLQEKLKGLDASLETIREARRKQQAASRQSYLETFSKQEALAQQKQKVDSLFLQQQQLHEEIARLRAQQGNLAGSVEEEYLGEEMSEQDLQDLQHEVDRAAARLELAQDIDPEIEKEFRATDERYSFLSGQIQDLTKSIESLDGIILELESQMKEIFENGFEKLRREFKRFFATIFSGGSADLIYFNTSEGEKGVDISAEIPGKRVKRVETLSGGERSLVSVALIFAIVAISEPPFLVLDEIDAPLDENNCRKFATILKELSQKTQFIVITHNRETMQAAGALYGVTMNAGASQVLSMKLEV